MKNRANDSLYQYGKFNIVILVVVMTASLVIGYCIDILLIKGICDGVISMGLVTIYYVIQFVKNLNEITLVQQEHEGFKIDTPESNFFLVMIIMGIVVILFNHYQWQNEFFKGIGAGLSAMGGLLFVNDLIKNFLVDLKRHENGNRR